MNWKRSTRCSGGTCVEASFRVAGIVNVRDSKNPDGPALSFTRDEWADFVAGVKAGEFDG